MGPPVNVVGVDVGTSVDALVGTRVTSSGVGLSERVAVTVDSGEGSSGWGSSIACRYNKTAPNPAVLAMIRVRNIRRVFMASRRG